MGRGMMIVMFLVFIEGWGFGEGDEFRFGGFGLL